MQRVVQLLQRLGFIQILEKCQLEPSEKFTHLGQGFNMQDMTVRQGASDQDPGIHGCLLPCIQKCDEAIGTD